MPLWWWRQQLQQQGSEGGKFGSTLLYVHRNHKDYQGRGAQDGHMDFHTAPSELCEGGWLVECRFTSTETVGLLGTGAQDGHLDFHTAPELYEGSWLVECRFTSTETVGLLGTGALDGHLDLHTPPEEDGKWRQDFIRRPQTWRCCKSSLLGQHRPVSRGSPHSGRRDGRGWPRRRLNQPHRVCPPINTADNDEEEDKIDKRRRGENVYVCPSSENTLNGEEPNRLLSVCCTRTDKLCLSLQLTKP